jgi:hypothetical protein
MKKAKMGTRIALWVCGVMLLGTVSVRAQEATGGKESKPGTKQCCGMMEGMMGKGKMEGEGMMPQMRTTHDQMAKMRQEMLREQQEQLTALRKHSQEIDRLTDEGQMMEAVKKHLRMTDALLETMVEQRAKMQGKMEEQDQQMQGQQKAQQQPAEENKPEGHEEHHDGE